jgi:hypothetical protein
MGVGSEISSFSKAELTCFGKSKSANVGFSILQKYDF